jgi:hypothetical protein
MVCSVWIFERASDFNRMASMIRNDLDEEKYWCWDL